MSAFPRNQIIRVKRRAPHLTVEIVASGPTLNAQAQDNLESICREVADLAMTLLQAKLYLASKKGAKS